MASRRAAGVVLHHGSDVVFHALEQIGLGDTIAVCVLEQPPRILTMPDERVSAHLHVVLDGVVYDLVCGPEVETAQPHLERLDLHRILSRDAVEVNGKDVVGVSSVLVLPAAPIVKWRAYLPARVDSSIAGRLFDESERPQMSVAAASMKVRFPMAGLGGGIVAIPGRGSQRARTRPPPMPSGGRDHAHWVPHRALCRATLSAVRAGSSACGAGARRRPTEADRPL
jgi:hypothetical protein